ncbi:MAG: hypothetical protein K0R09_3682 [Clostridiales bacterium]|jgi:hypothetical protein|nr:hypothetical protein [Clostridiales bacterium]
MDKNAKILYCIFGSAILALLNNPIFSRSMLGIFQSGYGRNLLGVYLEFLTKFLTNILSLVGFILLIIFSIMLIIRNVNLKDK